MTLQLNEDFTMYELEAEAKRLDLEPKAKLVEYARVLRTLEKKQAKVKAQRERLQAEEKRLGEQAEHLLSAIRAELGEGNDARLDPFAFEWKRSTFVHVADGAELPKRFLRVKTEPDKTKLKAALEEGKEIPGVSLGERWNLSVKEV